MLSGLILGGAISFNCFGYYQLKKAKQLGELFIKVEKIQGFNYNYVENISFLTSKKKPILLAANIVPEDSLNFKTYIDVKEKNQEHSYVRHDGNFNFRIHSEKNGFITIKNQEGQKTRVYNITQGKKLEKSDYSKLENMNLFYKIKNTFGQLNLHEFNTGKEGQQYVFIGNVRQSETNKQETEMKVEAIIGENKDSYLQFIDQYIMQVRKKQYICFGLGFGFMFVHMLLFKLGLKNKENEILQEMENKN